MKVFKITEKEQADRQFLVQNVKEKCKLDGFEITPRIERLSSLYIAGQIDLKEFENLLDLDTIH
ncbi:antitoxin VbhA family protein [uncultured Xanthomonas sp.]|uniref:antitoxin VbhA family protein n=1 Tax=uncultured Xanthomonas sp. TaxID=152831 RepID=UPI0025DFF2E8|nr:antitoxin VbhA family protein [uncultured Xanthomonas sp.]